MNIQIKHNNRNISTLVCYSECSNLKLNKLNNMRRKSSLLLENPHYSYTISELLKAILLPLVS